MQSNGPTLRSLASFNIELEQFYCKGVFLKYLFLNSKLGILDNFPNDGTVFPTTSKKINQKAQSKKKLESGGIRTPTPHLVVKIFVRHFDF